MIFTGKSLENVINQAIPLMVAQLIQILYNVVDRIYIGHLPVIGSNALTGIGLVFPITTLVAAFTNLFSTGGVPLFSMARGAKEEKKAELILGQVVSLLLLHRWHLWRYAIYLKDQYCSFSEQVKKLMCMLTSILKYIFWERYFQCFQPDLTDLLMHRDILKGHDDSYAWCNY